MTRIWDNRESKFLGFQALNTDHLLNDSILFLYEWVEYIRLQKIVYKYYKYLWVEFILLIFMNLYLEVGLQNKP
jgi:hypothetical protein